MCELAKMDTILADVHNVWSQYLQSKDYFIHSIQQDKFFFRSFNGWMERQTDGWADGQTDRQS